MLKKYFYMVMVALFAALPFALTSCGDDDDDEGSSSAKYIQINGKSYEIDPYITMEGYLDENENEGTFTVSVFEQVGSTKDCIYYTFYYTDTKRPAVGDDFSKKSLKLESVEDLSTLSYKSGSAKVVSVDKEKGIINIKFDNLKMENSEYSYTFKGTAPVDFNYGRTSFWD